MIYVLLHEFLYSQELLTPLHISADNKHLDMCRVLIQAGADVDA